MNRGTVVFLALAILLAHTFAIHQTPEGDFGPPYEMAHVAYRLGRNLAYEGEAQWNPGEQKVESYPSTGWVLISAIAARTYTSPMLWTQGLGLFLALSTVVVLAQFSPKRSAGLIAPLLLAVSGSAAAAALSGTEASAALFLTSASFLAFERGWKRPLALALSLLVLTRPEALAFVLMMALLETFLRPRGEHARRPPVRGALLFTGGVILVHLVLRRWLIGTWLSPFASNLLERDPARWRLGLAYLWSFVYASGFGLLLAVLPPSLLLGRASAMGVRALLLVAAWWGVVVLSGGDELPFWNALAPVLPLLFLGLQDCLREWMDRQARTAPAVWSLLLVSVLGAFLASKVPGDLGPLRMQGLLTRWQTPGGVLWEAYERPLGRLGLLEEIRSVQHLRNLGVFLRDRVAEDASILTLWPGAIGYLSRKEVEDFSGRAWPLPGSDRTQSWRGAPRVDVLKALAHEADYLVPVIGTLSESKGPGDLLRNWLARADRVGATEQRRKELVTALRNYELVYVPVRRDEQGEASEFPFPLLRRKSLGLAPRLRLELEGRRVHLELEHAGGQQVADACVLLVDDSGRRFFLRPTGAWVSEQEVDARTSLLLFPAGRRSVRLLEAELPVGVEHGRLTAWLHNPGMAADAPLAAVGLPTTLEFGR